MKAIQIEIKKSQFLRILNQLDEKDKLELFYELRKSLFLKRYNKLLESTRTDELTMDEITQEVESVRKNKNKNLSKQLRGAISSSRSKEMIENIVRNS